MSFILGEILLSNKNIFFAFKIFCVQKFQSFLLSMYAYHILWGNIWFHLRSEIDDGRVKKQKSFLFAKRNFPADKRHPGHRSRYGKYGPRSGYGFLRTACQPIRIENFEKPYNNDMYDLKFVLLLKLKGGAYDKLAQSAPWCNTAFGIISQNAIKLSRKSTLLVVWEIWYGKTQLIIICNAK